MDWQEWLETPNEEINPDYLRRAIRHLKSRNFPNHQMFKEAKTKLETKLTEITKQRSQEEVQKNKEREKENEEKAKELITQNLPFIVFEVDNRKVPINPKTLEVTVSFRPCGHKQTIKVYDLLYSPIDSENQWQIKLTRWEAFINNYGRANGSLNCVECRKKKPSILRGKDRPLGWANWTLRRLQ